MSIFLSPVGGPRRTIRHQLENSGDGRQGELMPSMVEISAKFRVCFVIVWCIHGVMRSKYSFQALERTARGVTALAALAGELGPSTCMAVPDCP